MPDWQAIREALGDQGIETPGGPPPQPLGGGDISAAWRTTTDRGPIFLKTGDGAAFERLDAEAHGLRELAQTRAVRVPKVLASGRTDDHSFLALEWLSLKRPDAATAKLMGRQLAQQHRQHEKQFGWHRGNTIGNTPQINTRDDNWVRFFRERRLHFQLELAAENGFGGELQDGGMRLAEGIERLFDDYDPQPSLLHGDLWGGNWASVEGEPVIFDPAVYYGDRESDIAMTRLFGGFGKEFYDAYEESWPLAAGHQRRLPLYQLYHVLNHLNLFGGAYLGQSLHLMRKLNRPTSGRE
ncbi:MAG: fructosamine kinase family protein [Woeseiaceae bacterium]